MNEKKMFHEDLFVETEQGIFLIAKKCSECGNIQFPQKGFCQKCLNEQLDDVLIGQKGTLFSFTTTFGKFSNMTGPFDVGYIELPEGIRVFAPIRKEETEEYAIGMEMELEEADLWEEEDTVITGYRYRTAKT